MRYLFVGSYRLTRVPGYHPNQHTVFAQLTPDGFVDNLNVIEIIFRPASTIERSLLSTQDAVFADNVIVPETPPNSPTVRLNAFRTVIPATPPINIPVQRPNVRRRLFRTCQYCLRTSICFPISATCGRCTYNLCDNCAELPNYSCLGICS